MIDSQSNPKILMQSLCYPAVLGAALVFMINKFASSATINDAFNIPNCFGAFLVIFCSATYLEVCLTAPNSYGIPAFIADFLEIIMIFLAFAALGFIDLTGKTAANLSWFYLYASIGIVLQQFWMEFVGKGEGLFWWGVCLSVTGIMVFGFLWGAQYDWYNRLMLGLFLGVFGWYFFFERKGLKHTSPEDLPFTSA